MVRVRFDITPKEAYQEFVTATFDDEVLTLKIGAFNGDTVSSMTVTMSQVEAKQLLHRLQIARVEATEHQTALGVSGEQSNEPKVPHVINHGGI